MSEKQEMQKQRMSQRRQTLKQREIRSPFADAGRSTPPSRGRPTLFGKSRPRNRMFDEARVSERRRPTERRASTFRLPSLGRRASTLLFSRTAAAPAKGAPNDFARTAPGRLSLLPPSPFGTSTPLPPAPPPGAAESRAEEAGAATAATTGPRRRTMGLGMYVRRSPSPESSPSEGDASPTPRKTIRARLFAGRTTPPTSDDEATKKPWKDNTTPIARRSMLSFYRRGTSPAASDDEATPIRPRRSILPFYRRGNSPEREKPPDAATLKKWPEMAQ